MTAKEIMLRAADLIDQAGWFGAEGCKDTEHCIFTAMCETTRRPEPGLVALRTAVGRESVIEWNDEPGRTKEEVVGKLREVAATL